MTPEERIAVLEVIAQNQADELREVKADLKSIKDDLGQLVRAAAMGKGAWWMLLKVGGVIVTVGGAGAWIYDRFMVGPHP